MKKILLFLSLFFALPLATGFATPFSGTGCTFGPTKVIVGFNYFPNTTCYINGSLLDMGTGAYVGGSIGTNVTFNTFSTTKQGYLGMCQLTSCANIGSTTLSGTCSTIICHNVEIETTTRTGPQGPMGATGSIGPQGPIGATGSTGATGSFIYNSGAIKGTFDNLQASYDLPQWVLTLHLSSPGDIQGAEEDVIVSGTGMYIASSTPIADPADPRIMMVVKSTETGTGVSCGWYTVTVPPSLVQGTMYANANPDPLTTKFELYGCDGYKTTAPPVYMLQSQETPFVAPSASGSYLAITYKDSVTGATIVDFYALLWLLVYISGALAVFYGLFKLFKKALTGRW